MRCKVKTIVAFWQCVSAVPSVFNVIAPPGLEAYTDWLDVIEFPAFGIDLALHAVCMGSYRRRLMISACWPIAFLLASAVCSVGFESFRARSKACAARLRVGTRAGLLRILPLTLLVTFLLLPSITMRIFNTFLCDAIPFDEHGEVRRYLHDDLRLSCSSGEYEAARSAALALVVVWPVGAPVLFALLVFASRDSLRTGKQSELSRATAFMTADCKELPFDLVPSASTPVLALVLFFLYLLVIQRSHVGCPAHRFDPRPAHRFDPRQLVGAARNVPEVDAQYLR